MRQFVLAPDQTAISFEELALINTARSVTILDFSALTLLVQIEGRLHLLPQIIDLAWRTQLLPETIELYSLIGECLCLLSASEFTVIADRTRLKPKIVNVPFAIDKLHSEANDEWKMAIFHLKGRTLRVTQGLLQEVAGTESVRGVDLFVV